MIVSIKQHSRQESMRTPIRLEVRQRESDYRWTGKKSSEADESFTACSAMVDREHQDPLPRIEILERRLDEVGRQERIAFYGPILKIKPFGSESVIDIGCRKHPHRYLTPSNGKPLNILSGKHQPILFYLLPFSNLITPEWLSL